MEDMQFPELVYRGFGQHQRPGGTYDFVQVDNKEEFDMHLASGWFLKLSDAIQANDSPKNPNYGEDSLKRAKYKS